MNLECPAKLKTHPGISGWGEREYGMGSKNSRRYKYLMNNRNEDKSKYTSFSLFGYGHIYVL